MIDRILAKENAKKLLNTNYWHMVGAYILITVIMLAASSILPTVGGLVICGILSVGQAIFLLKARKTGKADLVLTFDGFKTNIGNNIIAGLLVSLYTFLWSLLFVIPGIVKAYSYSMTYYIMAENPNMTPSQAIEESKRLTDGFKWYLFVLDLSFIGWHLLSGLTCGILDAFYVGPYVRNAKTEYYEALKAAKNVSYAQPEITVEA